MENKEHFFSIGLPKWPALVVVGRPVTYDQAREIIIRTDDFHFSTNNRGFKRQLEECVYGHREDEHSLTTEERLERWSKENERKAELGLLNLEYLNNHRIVSSFIGGPHGWCNWDGTIGCNTYNIGKWPSVEEVYDEWVEIAAAFPFLHLTCQLMNHESGFEESNDDPRPLIEFRIKDGEVTMNKPFIPLSPTSGISMDHMVELIGSGTMREVGCSLDRFKSAIQYVEQKIKLLRS